MEEKIKDARLTPDTAGKTRSDTTESRSDASLTAQSICTPIGIPPEGKRSEIGSESHITPILDEARLWAAHADLIASIPAEDRAAVKLGILEDYISAGIRQGKPMTTLFLLACLGISIANNDRPFYDGIRNALSYQKS